AAPEFSAPFSVATFAAASEEAESIFAAPESSDDALFGGAPVPKIEMPSKAAAPPPETRSTSPGEAAQSPLPPMRETPPAEVVTTEVTAGLPENVGDELAVAWVLPPSEEVAEAAPDPLSPEAGARVSGETALPLFPGEETSPVSEEDSAVAETIRSFSQVP